MFKENEDMLDAREGALIDAKVIEFILSSPSCRVLTDEQILRVERKMQFLKWNLDTYRKARNEYMASLTRTEDEDDPLLISMVETMKDEDDYFKEEEDNDDDEDEEY